MISVKQSGRGEKLHPIRIGSLVALMIGAGGAWLLGMIVPPLPTHTAWLYVVLAEIPTAIIDLLAGELPAHRAANLDPIEALRAE